MIFQNLNWIYFYFSSIYASERTVSGTKHLQPCPDFSWLFLCIYLNTCKIILLATVTVGGPRVARTCFKFLIPSFIILLNFWYSKSSMASLVHHQIIPTDKIAIFSRWSVWIFDCISEANLTFRRSMPEAVAHLAAISSLKKFRFRGVIKFQFRSFRLRRRP